MKKLTLIAAILMTAELLFAQIIIIPDDYPTIQQGIDAANEGDTILVQPGLYFENLVLTDDNDQGITLASLFLTTGDTAYISQTVIDGGQDSSVISIHAFLSIIDIEIKGFTIQHGTAYSYMNNKEYGGGICIFDYTPNFSESNNIILSNLIICDNFAESKGGGVYIGCSSQDSISNVYIKDVIIRNNNSHHGKGGGIYCENIDPVLEDVVLEENIITWDDHAGLAGYFYQSKPRLQNVRVMSNTGGLRMNEPPVKSIKSSMGLDALVFDHSSPLLQNVLIAENTGAGIYLRNSEAVLCNNTLTYNSSYGMECDSSSVTMLNSIFWGNAYLWIPWSPDFQVALYQSTCSVSYCDIQDGIDGIFPYQSTLNWLESNISDDPLFENTGDSAYQLSFFSPCIDSGTPDTVGLNLPSWDLLGNIRIWDGDGNGVATVDMGAYEFGAIPVGIENKHILRSAYNVRSFPNPFSERCFIEFELTKPARVSIQIYNNAGVMSIVSKNQNYSFGKHRVNLNLIELKKGIYFCRVQIGNEVVTNKIIKL